MKANRVKAVRTRLKLSQRQLAAAVGTSQQQIQRIETGVVAARLDLAKRLSAALGEPLETLFPGSGKVMKKLKTEFKTSKYIPTKTYSELSDLGIEADVASWYFKLLLRGHNDELLFEIPAAERRRLYSQIQDETDALSFVVFDTETCRIAVNLGEMVYCQFLFDVGVVPADRSEDDEWESEAQIYFVGSTKPIGFTPEVDRPDPDGEGDAGDFGNIFWSLELDPQRHDRYRFTDVDGEDVFVRAGDIALLKVPLWVVRPELLDSEEEEHAESKPD